MAYCIWRSYKLKIDPALVFEALKDRRHCFFLDSSLNSSGSSRYSFLGADPFAVFKKSGSDPFDKLRAEFEPFRIPRLARHFPFTGGAVGYLSYDLGFSLEDKLVKKTADDVKIPDCFFAFYNTAVVIDNLKNILHVFSAGIPEKSAHMARALAKENLRKIERALSGIRPHGHPANKRSKASGLCSNFNRGSYCAAVKRAKQYIKDGDIYQVNLSQRFRAKTDLGAPQIYLSLRKTSPSPFGAYFDAGEFQILSSSPERFLKLDKGLVVTRPMKGTRPRGRNSREDATLKKELLNSRKDEAELTMIVDLERNDLGKVCDYDSVKVESLRQIEEYSTVFQTTATVAGCLHKDKDRFDLLRACFPGGSITGCPKIRSMEIIEELEPSRRGIYTGSLGYLSFSGGMDFNILIRTILKKGRDLYFGAGAGIVADSAPEAEYDETMVKAKGIMEAIRAG